MKKFRNLQTGFPVMSENRFRAEGVVMNIYICDDQEGELKQLQQIVLEYAAENPELCIAAQCFVRPFDLLNVINRNGAPDIALLDICMPGILGTEVAKEILNKSEGSRYYFFNDELRFCRGSLLPACKRLSDETICETEAE